jgi:glycerophosphoryl diester phosphodiesterase
VDRLLAYLRAHGHPIDDRLWIFADGPPIDRLLQLAPQAVAMSTPRAKECTSRYLALGWSGYVPAACRHGFMAIPSDLRWAFWGWPNRLVARMRAAGGEVVLVGPRGTGASGISDPSELDGVPRSLPVLVLTNEVEKIGPAVQHRGVMR